MIGARLLRVVALVFIAAFAVGCRSARDADAANVTVAEDLGQAPAFTLTDLNGERRSFDEFAGQGVILDFWGTWCTPCIKEIPHFIELYEANKDKGLVVIGVSLDESPEKVAEFVEEYGVTYPILVGKSMEVMEVARKFGGVRYIPTTFVIRHDGRIVKKLVGYHDKATFEAFLPEILPSPTASASR